MRLIDADEALKLVSPIVEEDKKWSVTGETAKRLIINTIKKTPTLDSSTETKMEGISLEDALVAIKKYCTHHPCYRCVFYDGISACRLNITLPNRWFSSWAKEEARE